MRTNIVLDDELVERARQLTGIKTKREIVDRALRLLVRLYEQAGVRRLRGELRCDGYLDEMRRSRRTDAAP